MGLALPLLLLTLQPAPVSVSDGPWVEDFDKARELAAKTQRDLLVNFTGSDWCSYCKKLKRKVLSQAVFTELAAADYVLVKVDIPRTPAAKAKVPDLKRNRQLAREYSIQTYPTLVLMTADGYEYGRTFYEDTDALGYWKSLSKARSTARTPVIEAVEVVKGFESADAAGKVELAARGLEVLPKLPPASPVVPLMIPVVGHYLTLDPENKAGNLARALRCLLPSGYATPEQKTTARKLDPKNEQGLYELAVLADAYTTNTERDSRRVALDIQRLDAMGPIQDEQAARVLYTNGALWTDRFLRDTAKAKMLARKALPFVEKRPQLLASLRRLLNK